MARTTKTKAQAQPQAYEPDMLSAGDWQLYLMPGADDAAKRLGKALTEALAMDCRPLAELHLLAAMTVDSKFGANGFFPKTVARCILDLRWPATPASFGVVPDAMPTRTVEVAEITPAQPSATKVMPAFQEVIDLATEAKKRKSARKPAPVADETDCYEFATI